jgi:hypothetical protein
MYAVKCSRCKNLKKVTPRVIKNRLAKYGTIEEIEAKWICYDCRREIKNLPPINRLRKNKESTDIITNPSEPTTPIIPELTGAEK